MSRDARRTANVDTLRRGTVVCVNPNVSVDHTVVIDRFETGRVYRTERSRAVAGGKGLNLARGLLRLHQQPIALGMIGGHSGELAVSLALDEGIQARWVAIAGSTRICTAVVESATGAGTMINEAGPTVSESEWAAFEDAILETARPAAAVCFAGSLPLGVSHGATGRLIERLKAAGARVYVDTHSEALKSAMEARPYCIKVNGDEAAAILGRPVADIEEAATAAERIRAGGISEVVITLGRLGAVVASGSGTSTAVAPVVETKSGIGSGDAFFAGYVAAELQGLSPADALRHGVAAGAANACSRWGGFFELDDFERILTTVSVASAAEPSATVTSAGTAT